MQDRMQCNNLKTQFGVAAIPQDTQLRETLDNVPTEALNEAFADFLHRLQRGKQLVDYQRCRAKFTSRKEYWNHLRVAIRLLLFRDFYHLLRFVTDPPQIKPP